MPTYEYACKDCGEHLDVVQSFHDDPLTECPTCGGTLRKVFSAAGIIFKGSGWHIKDYGNSGPSSGRGGSDDAGSSEGSSSSRSGSSGTDGDSASTTSATSSGKGSSTSGTGSDRSASAKSA